MNTYGDTLPYETPVIASKYFMVYETRRQHHRRRGRSHPLNLYYSRATVYVYEVMDYTTPDDDELLDRWPWLENKDGVASSNSHAG